MPAMPSDASAACPRGPAVLSVDAHSGLPLMSTAAAGLAVRLPCAALPTSLLLSFARVDPLVVFELLRLANSPIHGAPGCAGTTADALGIVGRPALEAVLRRRLARLGGAVTATQDGDDVHVMTGTLASLLAADDDEPHEFAYTAGLLHDLGGLLMRRGDGRARGCGDCVQAGDRRRIEQRLACERSRWGRDHAALGRELLERARVPSALLEAVAGHHARLAPRAGVARAVWRACAMLRRADPCVGATQAAAPQDARFAAALVAAAREAVRRDAQALALALVAIDVGAVDNNDAGDDRRRRNACG